MEENEEVGMSLFAIYSRVSTDEQNIDQQNKMLKDFAKSRNLKIRSYSDFGVSGKISDRPEWNRLIKDIEKNKIQGLIVTKWDRITRDLEYALEFLKFWKKYQFKLLSTFEGEYIGTPDNTFSFKLKCLLSEYELEQLAWRRQIGIERAKLEGKYKGRVKGSRNKK